MTTKEEIVTKFNKLSFYKTYNAYGKIQKFIKIDILKKDTIESVSIFNDTERIITKTTRIPAFLIKGKFIPNNRAITIPYEQIIKSRKLLL